jgi:ABC-type lipoprotein release transport system permease subunit
MIWIKMAWRNLWRNTSRTLVELLAIAGSLFLGVFTVNLQEGSYSKMIDMGVKMGCGHLAFYQRDYLADRKTDQLIDPAEPLAVLAGDARVRGVFPRLIIPGLVQSSSNSRSGLILGLDFHREKGNHPLLEPKHLKEGVIPEGSGIHVLVGSRLASDLGVGIGKKFVAMFQNSHGKIASKLLRVGGIFRTGIAALDGGTILMERAALAEEFGKPGLVHELAVALHQRKDMEALTAELRGRVWRDQGMRCFPWPEAMPEMATAIRMDRSQGLFILAILFLIVGIGTANTLLMSVMDRTREFGLMRALGLGAASILRIVLAEAVVLGVLGVAIGLWVGVMLTWYYHVNDMDFRWMMAEVELAGVLFEPVIRSAWDVKGMVVLSFGLLLLVLVASLYPARQALKIRPAEAMRRF